MVHMIFLVEIVCLTFRSQKLLSTIFQTCLRKGTNTSEHLQRLLITSISVFALAQFLCNFIDSQVAINLSDLHISTDNVMQIFKDFKFPTIAAFNAHSQLGQWSAPEYKLLFLSASNLIQQCVRD